MLFTKSSPSSYHILLRSGSDMKPDMIVETFHHLADDSFSFDNTHHGLRGNTMMTLTFDGDSEFVLETASEDIAQYFELLAYHKKVMDVQTRLNAKKR